MSNSSMKRYIYYISILIVISALSYFVIYPFIIKVTQEATFAVILAGITRWILPVTTSAILAINTYSASRKRVMDKVLAILIITLFSAIWSTIVYYS